MEAGGDDGTGEAAPTGATTVPEPAPSRAAQAPGDTLPLTHAGAQRPTSGADEGLGLAATEVLVEAKAPTPRHVRREPVVAVTEQPQPHTRPDFSADPSPSPEDRGKGPRSPEAPGARAGLDFELRPFGPYEQVEVLRAQGNIGVVARGLNSGIGRWELLKFLRSSYQSLPEVVRQFRAEGKALALLSHPNVVQVFATYELDGRTCLALELLKGESLEERAARGPLSAEEGLSALLDAARGLAAVHAIGLLHRDIKPANLFITEAQLGRSGGLKLIDFGLAATDTRRSSVAGQDPALRSEASGGTPLFMAPELWRGQEPLPASDIYALGLSFYVAFTGGYPFDDLSLAGVAERLTREEPLPSVLRAAPELPAPLARLIDRMLSLDAAQRPSTDELVAQLVTLSLASAPPVVPSGGPYRGLAAFGRDDRGVFFGRDAETVEICERLRSGAAVVLVGPAGSGKTSLAMAGVAPAIEQGALGLGLAFQVEAIRLGGSPTLALAAGLERQLGVSAEDIARLIASQPEELGPAALRALPAGRGVVLFVDALEDLLRPDLNPTEVQQLALALGSLCRGGHPGLRLLAAAQGEQMSSLSSLTPLRRALTQGYHPLRPLGEAELRQIIEGPAERAGFRVEPPDAAQRIAQALEPRSLSLPLLSLALAEWWALRDSEARLLSEAAWERLGGVSGAVARHAERVVAGFGAAEQRAAEELLVRLGLGGHPGARGPNLALGDERSVASARALEQLLAARLVTEREGHLALSSPALVQHWPRLARWLTEAGEDRAFHQRLVDAAAQWDAGGRSEGALWDGALAERLLGWFRETELGLTDLELAFTEAVRRRRTRSRALRFGASLVVVGGLFGLLVVSRAREASLAARVERLTTDTEARQATYQRRLAWLQTELAEHRLAADPAGALRAAQRAYDTGSDPALDLVGWRALRAGIPRALPANPSGAHRVRFDPRGSRLAVSWVDGSLQLLSANAAVAWPADPLSGQADLIWSSRDGGAALLAHLPLSDKSVQLTIKDGELQATDAAGCGSQEAHLAFTCGESQRTLARVPGAPGKRGGYARITGDELKWQSDSGYSVSVALRGEPRAAPDAQSALREAARGAERSAAWQLSGYGSRLVAALGRRLIALERGDDALGGVHPVGLRRHYELSLPQGSELTQLAVTEAGFVTVRHERIGFWREQGTSAALEREREAPSVRGLIALPARGLVGWIGGLGVELWDSRGEQQVGLLSASEEHLTRLEASDDGRWLVAYAASGRVLLFDLDLAAPQVTWGDEGACQLRGWSCASPSLAPEAAPEAAPVAAPLAVPHPVRSERGLVAWVEQQGEAQQLLVRAPGAALEEAQRIPLRQPLLALTASADGGAVHALSAAGVQRVDASGLSQVAELRVDAARPAALALSLDEEELLVVQGEARLVRLSDGSVRSLPNTPPEARCGAFSRGGQALIFGTDDGAVWLYSRASARRAQVSGAPRAITHCERLGDADRFAFAAGERHFSERYWLLPVWQLVRPDRLERGAPEPWAGLVQYE